MPTRSQDQTQNLHILGTGRLPAFEDGPGVGLLESFPNCYPQRPYVVSISFPEFTSLCPVTGQPDCGTISVEYVPDKLCVESKSFKLYMFAFRNHQSFMETITNTVLEDLRELLAPCWWRHAHPCFRRGVQGNARGAGPARARGRAGLAVGD